MPDRGSSSILTDTSLSTRISLQVYIRYACIMHACTVYRALFVNLLVAVVVYIASIGDCDDVYVQWWCDHHVVGPDLDVLPATVIRTLYIRTYVISSVRARPVWLSSSFFFCLGCLIIFSLCVVSDVIVVWVKMMEYEYYMTKATLILSTVEWLSGIWSRTGNIGSVRQSCASWFSSCASWFTNEVILWLKVILFDCLA
jgi:hypothetical protein